MMKRIRWILELGVFIFLSLPIAILPFSISIKIGQTLGFLMYLVWGTRRNIAIDNIKRAGLAATARGPQMIARESFINLGMSFTEIVKIYYGLGKGIIHSVEITGIEHYKMALENAKGVILITGHCGNWELFALAFGLKVAPGAVVARAQNNRYLNRIIERVRSKYGNRVIYKSGALRHILKELKQNHAIGILMDQAVVEAEGIIIEFLGRNAWTTKMPALIARKTGACVVPAFIKRQGSRHLLSIYPMIEPSTEQDTNKALYEDTLMFTSFIENYIRENPAQWLWLHRRWKRITE